MYRRSRTMKLSIARVSTLSRSPHTSWRMALRDTGYPAFLTRYRSRSHSITVSGYDLSPDLTCIAVKSIVRPANA